jgi:tetratricopeptide (TPR) repeat protein
MTRREFAASAAIAAFAGIDPPRASAVPFPVHFARASPRDMLVRYVEPGFDAFAGEKDALEIEARLRRIFSGAEAAPPSLREWAGRRPQIRWARFHVLPEARVRFEIALAGPGGLEHHTGLWGLPDFSPVEANSMAAPAPWFGDVTAHTFGETESFAQQLLQGNPWWRSRLDSAAGIDVDGNQGIAVADIDNDGVDEIYVCQPGGLPNRLYKIGPDGKAQDITRKAGLDILDETTCALFADFRNSGLQDLVVLRRSGPLLFLNQGNGVFRERPDAFRFQRAPRGAFTGMSAADYDRDGRLDLYLCTYVYVQGEDVYQYPAPYHDARNGPPNYLLRNRAEADGPVFDDVTEESGIDENNDRFSFAASWCDFDGDGWPDLYVANDFGKNNLYRNRNGRFTDEAARAGVEDIGAGMSAAWFDYNGDGLPDLYISNMWTAAGQRVVRDGAFAPAAGNEEAYRRHTKGNSLYRNRGDGAFEETGPAEGVEMGRWAWSSGGFDFDLDGSPEIFNTAGMVSNGVPTDRRSPDLESFFWRQVVARSPATARADAGYENGWNAIGQLFREEFSWNGQEPNVFYVRRDGRYKDASGISGLDFADDSRAFAVTDFDGDGYPDIVLKSRLAPQVRMMQNRCGGGRPAIALRLRGTKSNRDAVGARVTVNGYAQEITAGSGFLSQHSKRLHFGLRGRDSAEVHIMWPSGLKQEVTGLLPGYTWTVSEGSEKATRVPFRSRSELPVGKVVAHNQAEFADTWLLEPIPDPGRHAGPAVIVLQAVDLRREPEELAAAYELLHRYIFEFRTGLSLPLALLVDGESRVRKVYADVPRQSLIDADLRILQTTDESKVRRLAFPFPGRYYTEPSRNYFKIGVAFYWAGYPRRALPYLEEAVRATPGQWRALLALGEIHRELGDPDASLDAFQRALALQPNNAAAMVSVGISLLAKKDKPGARAMFLKAVETDSRSAEAANQLGLLEVQGGDSGEARHWFERAIEAQPDHSGALNNLGVLFAQKGQYDDSVAVFRYGLAKIPDDEPLHLNLARVYAMTGRRDDAIGILNELLERKPSSVAGKRFLEELMGR